jgi:hypothetical protein
MFVKIIKIIIKMNRVGIEPTLKNIQWIYNPLP